jgi:hypothetical protein
MSEFKLCKNGHYYPNSLEECPYCPKPASSQPAMNIDKTRVATPENLALDKTKIMNSSDEELASTKPGNLAKTQIFTGNNSNHLLRLNLNLLLLSQEESW